MRKAIVLDKSGTIVNPCRVIFDVSTGRFAYHVSTLKFVVEKGETLVNIRGSGKALREGRIDRVSLKVSCCAAKSVPRLDKEGLRRPEVMEGLRQVVEQSQNHCSSQLGVCAAIMIDGSGQITHLVGLGGRLYDEVQEVVRSMMSDGVDVYLATGNCREMTLRCADLLGIPHHFTIYDASPEEKRDLVRKLRGFYGSVIMVGNDVNDLVALREADVSVIVKRWGVSEKGLEGCRDVDYTASTLREVEKIVSGITHP